MRISLSLLPLDGFGLLLLSGSHSLAALALGKPLTTLMLTFMHFHFFTKKSSFNGKLTTHT